MLAGADDDDSEKSSPTKKSQMLSKLEILEGKDGVFCRGLTEHKVNSADDVLYAMKNAQKSRRISETKKNKQSSRSHCVFTIRLLAKKQISDGNIFETCGKLHLVDLAGSECAKSASMTTEARDERSRERSNINRSLLTLGRVILMLNEQSNSKKNSNLRIPYRDSKLTRILQDSLGGKCKTLIIATISPSILSIEETMSTLNYAQTASGIINKPIAVSYLSVGSGGSRATTASLSDSSEGKSLEDWRLMEIKMEYLTTQVQEAQAALARQYREQKEIIDRAEKAEEQLVETQDKLKLSEYNLKKSTIILETTRETERRLTSEANELMTKLEMSIADSNDLYDLLLKSRDADMQRREATKNFHAVVLQEVSLIKDNLGKLKEEGDNYHTSMISIAEDRNAQEHKELDESVQLLHEIQLQVSDLTKAMKSHVQDENGIMDILSKLADNVQENVKHAKQGIEKGESDLVTSINNTRQNLRTYSESLIEMEQNFKSVSGSFEQKMQSLITNANEKVNNMVSSAVDALLQAREDSSKTRQSLTETLATFHKVSASSISHIQEQSHDCSKNLTKSIESFTEGMKHIDEIDKSIDKQKSIMETKGVMHMNALNEQKNTVLTQGEEIIHAKTEQKRLEKMFVDELLKGVSELVNTQMQTLSEKHEERLILVEKQNLALSAITDQAKVSASEIFNSVDTTNQSIQELSIKCKQNDEELQQSANSINTILVEIDKISRSHREIESKFVETTNDNAKKFAVHEEAITTASTALKKDSMDSSNLIADKLHGEFKVGASKLLELANTHTKYARETAIKSTIDGLDMMEKPRGKVVSDFTNNISKVHETVTEGKQGIRKVVTLHGDIADELRNDIETRSRNFGDVATKRRSTIDAKKKLVADKSEGFISNETKYLSSTLTSASKTEADVEDFATGTIKVNEALPPLGDRKTLKYSRNLSSTPAEDLLIKDVTKGRE